MVVRKWGADTKPCIQCRGKGNNGGVWHWKGLGSQRLTATSAIRTKKTEISLEPCKPHKCIYCNPGPSIRTVLQQLNTEVP